MYKKWLDKNIPSLEGKIYVVTGANSGIGFETSFALAYKKAKVIMACRNLTKANLAKEKILSKIPDAEINLMEYDQASFELINKFILDLTSTYPSIDGIVCNAGVYFPKANYKTKDGYELTIGINYLGTYKLITGLKDYLDKNKSRVVLVSSLVAFRAKRIPIEKAFFLRRNSLYNYSKYCVSRLYYELSLENSNITYRVVHPGICSTNIIKSEQTGFPTWFGVISHKALTLFTHRASKGALNSVLGLVNKNNDKPYITPRGLFCISGYPKEKRVPKFMNNPIINETKMLLKEVK